MKNKRFLYLIVSVLLLIFLTFSFVSCNKEKTKDVKISDIFKSTTSNSEFTSYQKEIELPSGWEVYLKSSDKSSDAANINSDVGYVSSINGFVVKDKNDNLSIVLCGDSTSHFSGGQAGFLFPANMAISEIRVKNNLIACKLKNGEVTLYNFKGKKVLSNGFAKSTSAHLDSIISILDDQLIAVSGKYDMVNGQNNYVSIYRPTTSGDVSERGLFICNLYNPDNDLSYLNGFDGKYVSIDGNDEGKYIYCIPNTTVGVLNYTNNGFIEIKEDVNDYYCEILYIGNGKFFIHEDWTVSQTDNYIYYDNNKYYIFDRHIYTPSNDQLISYSMNSDKVFLTLSNNYYNSDTDFNTNGYLNDEYTYAAYGLYIVDKIGYYDQFILDSNMNIVMSLTGNFGVKLNSKEKNQVGYYDLIMCCRDGYFYNPLTPSSLNIYDAQGTVIGHNDKNDITSQTLSNNVIIASVLDSTDNSVTYGGFNIRGEEIIKFNYSQIYPYRGSYTAGQRKDNTNSNRYFIIGNDGYEITEMTDGSIPFSDIATTSAGTFIIKNGCYMFKKEIDSKKFFGIKNFNPDSSKNIIMNATMESGSMLYSPSNSQNDVFVIEAITSGEIVRYNVYRII